VRGHAQQARVFLLDHLGLLGEAGAPEADHTAGDDGVHLAAPRHQGDHALVRLGVVRRRREVDGVRAAGVLGKDLAQARLQQRAEGRHLETGGFRGVGADRARAAAVGDDGDPATPGAWRAEQRDQRLDGLALRVDAQHAGGAAGGVDRHRV
jgi:hypothetical protein